MWIKREDFERFLRVEGKADTLLQTVDAYKHMMETATDTHGSTEKQLSARIKLLEAEILKLQDELYKEKQARANHASPVALDSLFDEDPNLVRRDRARITTDGTSDLLLIEDEES